MKLTPSKRNKLLLWGGIITANVALTPLAPVAPLVIGATSAIAGVAGNLFASGLDDVSASTFYASLVEDEHLERAVYTAISALVLRSAEAHENRNFERDLTHLSQFDFAWWRAAMLDLEGEPDGDLGPFDVVKSFSLQTGGIQSLRLQSQEWEAILAAMEHASGILLHPTTRTNVAERLLKEFETVLYNSVASDQHLINKIVLKRLSEIVTTHEVSVNQIRDLPKAVAAELRGQNIVTIDDSTVSNTAPLVTEYFTGRTRVLTDIRKELTRSRVACLQGMFGLGKTTVALKFAHERRKAYSSIFFILSTNDEFLLELKRLAEGFDRVRCETLSSLDEKADFFKRYLSSSSVWGGQKKPWLLIFDNVEEPRTIRPYIPSTEFGHIIYTGNPRELTLLARQVDLKEFTPSEGRLLLFRRANQNPIATAQTISKKNRSILDQIVDELGGSPLGINLAGAFISSAKVSYSEYVELIRQPGGSNLILDFDDVSDLYQNRTIWRAFELSYDATCRPSSSSAEAKLIADAAMQMLHGSVFVAPDTIPEPLLVAYVASVDERMRKLTENRRLWLLARQQATSYDLLRYDPIAGHFSTHRLVQRILRELVTLNG